MSTPIHTTSFNITHSSELNSKFRSFVLSEIRKYGYSFNELKFNKFISQIAEQYYEYCKYSYPYSFNFYYKLNEFYHESYQHSNPCGLESNDYLIANRLSSYIHAVDPYFELPKTENKQNKLLLLL